MGQCNLVRSDFANIYYRQHNPGYLFIDASQLCLSLKLVHLLNNLHAIVLDIGATIATTRWHPGKAKQIA